MKASRNIFSIVSRVFFGIHNLVVLRITNEICGLPVSISLVGFINNGLRKLVWSDPIIPEIKTSFARSFFFIPNITTIAFNAVNK